MKNLVLNFKQNKKIIFINFSLMLLCIFIDQLTKLQAIEFLIQIPTNSLKVLPFFNLTLVLNTGVSFGMFAGFTYSKLIISVIVTCITIALFYLFLREQKRILSTAYALIIAGAVGNTIDRIYYGGVVDFLDFYIKNWHYPAFNGADSFIFIGAIILIFHDLFKKKI